ncbi:glycan metabolism protein RagB [Bacteroidales bacterium]|nr:glycan metabolism protein RagB [Bacteroidales bacterium]
MKTIIKTTGLLIFMIAMASCNDYLDKKPLSEYLSSNFYNNENAIKQGTNGVYQSLYMEKNTIPFCILLDMYTPMGIERADNSGIGINNINLKTSFTVESLWATLYDGVGRSHTVLDGAAPYMASLSDKAKQYLAEVRTIRATQYHYLTTLWGDVPFFTTQATPEEQKSAIRTSWMEVVDFLMQDLEDASTYLPWQATELGRADKTYALGLKARIALYAGSWCKEGFGESGQKNPEKAKEYFEIAAKTADRIILEGGRGLNPNFMNLYTREGQLTADSKKENIFSLMYSDQSSKKIHYQSFGEQSRIFAQSGRFPTQLMVDSYEMKNGKRIDEKGSAYNPQKPFENRDPRLKMTIYTHHDTIIGNAGGNKRKFLMELFNAKTTSIDPDGSTSLIDNLDHTGSVAQYGYIQSGVGYLWKKYNHFDDEAVNEASYNIILMRYAEILLTFAEARIELNQIDADVYSVIDQLRGRVNMPSILSVDPSRANNQDKMRQIVRRERRVELIKESGLHFFDMRRWRIADMQNAEKTYGFPLGGYESVTPDMVPTYGSPGSRRDLNDLALYESFASKLRSRDADRQKNWQDMFYLWPIPQTERSKAPQLVQNDGYGN